MWIVGNSNSLKKGKNWREILERGIEKQFIFNKESECNKDSLILETFKTGFV